MVVLQNLSKYDIVLASASPRRRELLQGLGIDFKVILRPVEEEVPANMDAVDVALHLCALKAAAFDATFFTGRTLLITADTIVCLGEQILGKPSNREEAIKMLELLSGKKHQVISGVSIRSKKKDINFSVSTDVYFKSLRMDEIIYYVDHFQPYDKAGSYGIQEWIGYIGVEAIEGSYYNVMGLPVLKVYEELRKF